MKHGQDHELTRSNAIVDRVGKVPDPNALHVAKLETVSLGRLTGEPNGLVYGLNDPAT